MIHLLLIETNKADRATFRQWAEETHHPYRYTIVETIAAAREVAAVDLILLGECGDDIQELGQETPLILMVRPGQEAAILQAGAWDYIIKTGDYLRLLPLTIANTLQRKRLSDRVQRLQVDCNEALRESEQKFRGIVEQARDGISLVDETGVVIEWNESMERITGLPVQAVLGHPMWEIQFRMASPEQQTLETYEHLQKTIRQLLQTGQAPWLNQLIEREYIHPDGSKRRIQGVVFPIKTDKGFMLGSISRDVTAYRQTAQDLRESEERFGHVVASISDHIYVTEITEEGTRLNHYISPHVEALTGYAQARFEADWSFWSEQVIHPEDRTIAKIQMEQLKEGYSHEVEYRLIRTGGEIIWVRDSAQVEYLGNRKMIYGLVSDITHRKEAETALKKSEARHRIISELISDYVYSGSIYPDGAILIEWITGAFERITGYTLAEINVAEQGWQSVIYPDDTPIFIEAMAKLLFNQAQVNEYRLMTKDGKIRWIRDYMKPVWSEADQRVTRFVGAVQDMTHRRQAELALRESEAKFRTLAETTTAAIFIIQGTRWSYLNPAIERMTGYTPQEMMKRPFWAIFDPDFQETAKERGLARQRGEQIPDMSEVAFHTKSGETRWAEVSVNLIEYREQKALLGTAFDITERKQTEADLAHRLKFEHLISATAARLIHALTPADLTRELSRAMRVIGGFLDMDRGYVFLFGNDPPHISAVYHWHRSGFNSLHHLQGLELTPFRWIMQEWQHKKSVYVPNIADVPAEAAAEKEVWLQEGVQTLITVPLLYQEKVIGVIGLDCIRHTKKLSGADIELIQTIGQMITNLLQRQRAELALAEEKAQLAQRVADRTAELRTANAELARAARLKDEFLASMSHELRTPLNAILGMAEILREEIYGDLSEKQQASIQTIEDSGRHLLELINDILDLSKIEAGQFDLEITPISVASVCRSSLNFVQQMAFKKDVRLTSCLDQRVDIIYADARRFKQILVNLLSNAVKFTPSGGKIGLEMSGDETERIVRFTVWDTGIGIAGEDMDRLFQPFVQLDSALSRQYEGTGLGLSLVYRLVDMHGGSIRVESKPGRGSRFTVTLPWPAEVGLPPVEKEETPPSLEMEGAAVILLAEDNLSNRVMVRDYLQARGFQVATVQDGHEALLYVQEERTDLILMDIQMPGMNGLEAIQQIRADESLPHIPIIALTALAMPGDRERCLNAGADEYMSKPIRLRKLLALIHRQLADHSPPET